MDLKLTNNSLPMPENDKHFQEMKTTPAPPFSAHTYFLIEVTIRVFLHGLFSITGLISNVINIIVFYRQGFLSHSSVVNLSALALSDFLSSLLCLWGAICGIFTHFFDTSLWSWDVHLFFANLGARPFNTVTQITSWVTAFLSFERAISVVFPFKAKSIFTPKRSLIIMIAIFTVTTMFNYPRFMLTVVWKTHSKTNHTYLTWKYYDFMTTTAMLFFFYSSPVVLRFLSILVLVVCNVIIFWKVYLSQKFRKASGNLDSRQINKTSGTQSSKNNQVTSTGSTATTATTPTTITKEMRLVRMITLISVVFMACYVPCVFYVVLYHIVWKINVDYHWWVDVVLWDSFTALQLVSASTNIFIYYTMSTRYREELQLCFSKKKK